MHIYLILLHALAAAAACATGAVIVYSLSREHEATPFAWHTAYMGATLSVLGGDWMIRSTRPSAASL